MGHCRAVRGAAGSLLLALALSACSVTPDPIEAPPYPAAPAVVFDIDGTLTPDVHAVFGVREDAVASVRRYSEDDIGIVYLSARTPLLQFLIPGWLEGEGFPEGSLQVTDSTAQREDVARFKETVLETFMAQGWSFVAAYGDSSSDFAAYSAAGIPTDRIYALKRRGEEDCQPGPWGVCVESWEELWQSIIANATAGEVRERP